MKKKSKIFYLVNNINDHGGGGNRSPRNFLVSLYDIGYVTNITLLTNSSNRELNKTSKLLDNNLKIKRIKYSIKGKYLDIRKDNVFIKILKIIKYISYNIFILTSINNYKSNSLLIVDNLFSHYTKKRNNIVSPRTILIWRITPESYFEYDNFGDKKCLNDIFSEYNQIIFPSKLVKEKWSKIYPNLKANFEYLYNCIDEEKNNISIESNKLKNISTIGCIGNLHFIKGQDIALNAFKRICQENNGINFYFAGKAHDDFGNKIIKDINKANDNIKYLSYCKNVMELLNNTDILVVPSRTEMFPRIVLEGLYCGCIVVASDVGGIPDMIKDNYNGYLFNVNNKNALYDIINNILKSDIQKNYKIRLNAKASYKDKFSQQKQKEKLKNIIQSILK